MFDGYVDEWYGLFDHVDMFVGCLSFISFFEDWLLVNGRGGGEEGQCGAKE